MKRLLAITIIAIAASCAASAQSMKMVVDSKGEVVGRLVKEKPQAYTILVQDCCDVPKDGLHVVRFSAVNGQGFVFNYNEYDVPVYDSPSKKGTVIGHMPGNDCIPYDYPCLGKVKGWYIIDFNDRAGYVKDSQLRWDGMITF